MMLIALTFILSVALIVYILDQVRKILNAAVSSSFSFLVSVKSPAQKKLKNARDRRQYNPDLETSSLQTPGAGRD